MIYAGYMGWMTGVWTMALVTGDWSTALLPMLFVSFVDAAFASLDLVCKGAR